MTGSALLAGLLLGCALAVLARPDAAAGRRLDTPASRAGASASGGRDGHRLLDLAAARSAWLSRIGVAMVAVLVLSGRTGLAVPIAIAVAAVVVPARQRAAAQQRLADQVARDLPRVADLLATCLEAGLAPAEAIVVACDAVGGPVRNALLPVATAVRLGVDPPAAWAALADASAGSLRRVARALARAAATGAPLADTLVAIADDERERLAWDAQAAARRAGVRAVGPLAVCFLPAFLLLGIVPVVVGVATDALGGLA